MSWLTPERRAVVRKISAYLPPLLLIVGAVALWVMVRKYRPQLRDANFHFSWTLLFLSVVVWLAGYLQLVQMWAASFKWWDSPRPRLFRAFRMFFLANLARYIPGQVWQFAGLSTMAAAEGASATAASMGVILMQVATLVTGAALTLSAAPRFVARWTSWLGVVGQAGLALVLLALLIVVLPRVLGPVRGWIERRIKRSIPIPTPAPGPFAVYVLRAALSWVLYGFAFWIFAVALMGNGAPKAWIGVTAYIASYMVGLLIVLAPGGIGVREAALVFCLQGSIGGQAAFILAVASRFWLVGMELGAAATVFVIDHAQIAWRRYGLRSTKMN